MSLLEGIYARLAADPGITGLDAGVFPALAPKESSLPYVVYLQVGGATVNSLGGANRLQSARLRFSCYGNSYGTAKGLAKAIKDSLNGLAVTLAGGIVVQGAWLEYEGDDAEPDLQGTVFASHVDFALMFVEVA
jgi:hypothetical protein